MEMIDDSVFQNLRIAKYLADSGFQEPFLEVCGGLEVAGNDFYEVAWEAISCIFPDATGYWDQEKEIDAIVIFDPLVDEFCRLLAQYEMTCGIEPGRSDLRHEATRYVYDAFELDDNSYSYYIYDYDFRIYDTGHGRKRLVFLSGMEFCGLQELPQALADVHCELERQVQRLRRELGVEQPAETTTKEAA